MIDAYIINLSKAHKRRERMQREIEKLGEQEDVCFHFYDAIDVNSHRFLEYKNRWNWDWLCRLYRGKKLSQGEKACFASHYSLWEKCIKDDKAILILEDDVIFLDGFIKNIENITNQKNIHFVRLMSYFQKKMIRYDRNLNLTFENICGTQGYFLTPFGARKLIEKSKIWFCPVDNFLDKSHLHSLPNLIVTPEIIKEESMGSSCIGGEARNQKPSFLFIIVREISSSIEFIWRKVYEIRQQEKK